MATVIATISSAAFTLCSPQPEAALQNIINAQTNFLRVSYTGNGT
jgi:hypothetical protein